MAVLADRFGRTFPYLRLSLIEACNFRCGYCLPEGYAALPGRPEPLRLDEIGRLLNAFSDVGLRKLRLTGGEPSLRKDLVDVIALAAAIPGLRTLAITTNGTQLDRRVEAWRAAGLTQLNVSSDSLDRALFAKLTGHDRLPELLRGIDLALGLGFAAIKINAVLLKDINDTAMAPWFDYLRSHRVSVRFIELMQTGHGRDYFERHHLRADGLEAMLLEQGWQEILRAADAGPAREFSHPDFLGRMGFIAPYAKDFCASCNRLRVTAMGDLRLCLFGNVGIPLRPLLQHDADRPQLVAQLQGQLGLKAAGHALHEGETGLMTHLSTVGG